MNKALSIKLAHKHKLQKSRERKAAEMQMYLDAQNATLDARRKLLRLRHPFFAWLFKL